MNRIVVSVLALLLVSSFALAKDRDRPRRDPSSAKPPPPDWKALIEKGEKDVRALLVPWLEARKAILAPCGKCGAGGRIPDPRSPGRTRPCPDCRASGFVLGPGFNSGAIDAPLFSRRDKTAYWKKIRRDPTAARRIAIAGYDIKDVRVLGDIAYAMVEVSPVPLHHGRNAKPDRVPDVTTWYRVGGRWKVLDPDFPHPITCGWGGLRVPPRLRPKPAQEGAALATLTRAMERLPGRPTDGMHGLTFRVVSRGPGAGHDRVFTATWAGGRFTVERKKSVFDRGADQAGRRAADVVKAFLDAVLSRDEALLPPPADYHLEMQPNSVVMRGFAPRAFMETVTVELGNNGLPRLVTRERPAHPTVRIVPRFEEQKGQVVLVGATRIEGKDQFEFTVRWAKERGLLLPKKAEIRVPGATWSLSLHPSWPKGRTGF